MTKRQKIAEYKRMIGVAQDMQRVARQNLSLATRLESEARSALEAVGTTPERAQKGKYQISDELRLKLEADLIK